MVRKDKVQVEVEVDGKQGINALGKLEMEAKDLRATLKDLKKGTEEYNQANEKLKNTRAAIGEIRDQMGLTGMTLKQLISYQKDLNAQWQNLTKGTEGWKQVDAQLKQVNSTINQQRDELKGTAGVWGFLKSEIGKYSIIALGAVGFDALIGKMGNMISRASRLSDAMADVRMTTGMSAAAVEQYNKALGTLGTRTSREDLLGIGKIAGQFGVATNEMLDFTKAMNMTSVVLSSEFSGGAQEITERMATLRNVFSDIKTANISDDITKISNAVVVLAQEGVATAPVVTDFSNRIAGIGIPLGLSSSQVLGLSATMQELGITAERGGTAVGKILQKMTTNTDEFAKVAGMDLKSFSELVNKDIYSAFLKVLEGSKKSGEAATVLGRLIKDLEISGAGASEVFNKLGGNMDLLQNRTRLAGNAIKETSTITEQYNVKNETFAANLERVQKIIAAWFTSNSFVNGIETMVKWLVKLGEVNVSDTLEEERVALNSLVFSIQNTTDWYGVRQRMIDKLIQQYPDFLAGLDRETVTNEQLQIRLAQVNAEYIHKIFLKKQDEELNKFGERELELIGKLTTATQSYNHLKEIFGDKKLKISQERELGQALSEMNRYKGLIEELNQTRNKFLKDQMALEEQLGGSKEIIITDPTTGKVTKGGKPKEEPKGAPTGGGETDEEKKAREKREKKAREENERALAELKRHLAEVDKVLEENNVKRELSETEKSERELARIDQQFMAEITKAEQYNAQAQANENLNKEQKLQAENEFEAKIFELNKQWIDARAAKEEELRVAAEAKKAAIQAEIELALMSNNDREIALMVQKYETLIAKAEEYGYNTLAIYQAMALERDQILEKQNLKEQKADDAASKKKLAAQHRENQAILGMTQTGFSAISDIAEMSNQNTASQAQFKATMALFEIGINQAVAISEAIASAAKGDPYTLPIRVFGASAAVISGFVAVRNAYSQAGSPPSPPPVQGFYYGGETGDENGQFVGRTHKFEYVAPTFVRHEPAVINAIGVIESYRQNAIATGRTSYSGPPPSFAQANSSAGDLDNTTMIQMFSILIEEVRKTGNKPVAFYSNDYENHLEELRKIEFLAKK